MRLENKIAIVTSATTSIGRAIAEFYYCEGASVVIAAIKGANEAASEM